MKPIINFEDYNKIEVRVGRIVEASVPEGSNKLVKLIVDLGSLMGKKTIFW